LINTEFGWEEFGAKSSSKEPSLYVCVGILLIQTKPLIHYFITQTKPCTNMPDWTL